MGAEARGLLDRAFLWLPPASRTTARELADMTLASIGSIYSSGREAPLVALTFDDGPDPVVTPKLLDLLRARHCQATFFVLISAAEKYPDLIRRIRSEGHELALHSDVHVRLTSIPSRELFARLGRARARLEALAEGPIRLFRPPFGAQTLRTYLIARWCGLDVVAWSADAEDYLEGKPAEVASRALSRLSGGGILLMHDGLEMECGEPPTFDRIDAVRMVLDGLEERRQRSVGVSDLLAQAGTRRRAWFPWTTGSSALRAEGTIRKPVLGELRGPQAVAAPAE